MNTMLKKLLIISVTFICLSEACFAENTRPLKIGDKVPDISFQLVDADKGNVYKGKLSDYKGKLVILDFWATTCRACLHKFPKMDTLQKKFGDKIKVLMVNSQIFSGKPGEAMKYIAKQKAANNWPFHFTLAIDDIQAYNFFPSYGIPHYAWINGDGRVVAITDAEQVTKENIQQIIDGRDIDLPVKKDFFPNKLSVEQVEIDDNLLAFSFLKRGRLEDGTAMDVSMIEELYSLKNDSKQTRGVIIKNLPLVELYKYALNAHPAKSRVILEVKHPANLDYKSVATLGVYMPEFVTSQENQYTYELVVPASDEPALKSIMLKDLNERSGYFGKMEKRKVRSFVIEPINKSAVYKISDLKKESTSPQRGVSQYESIDNFVYYLNNYSFFNQWMQIGSDYVSTLAAGKFNFVIDLNNPPNDITEIENQLKKYGLHFVQKEIELDMLVISDREN